MHPGYDKSLVNVVLKPHARSMPRREHTALFRIQERYAATPESRARLLDPHMVSPHEAVRLVAGLAAGSLAHADDSEPSVQDADLLAALSLLPLLRAELDDLELGLQVMARGEGATWAQIAAASGLGSPQAAQQRHDRLTQRTTD